MLELDLKDNLGVSESSDVTDQPSGTVGLLGREVILSLNTLVIGWLAAWIVSMAAAPVSPMAV